MATPLTVPGSAQDLDILARQTRHLLQLAEALVEKLRTAHREAGRETEDYLQLALGGAQGIVALARYQLGVGLTCALNPRRPLDTALLSAADRRQAEEANARG